MPPRHSALLPNTFILSLGDILSRVIAGRWCYKIADASTIDIVSRTQSSETPAPKRDELYATTVREFGRALDRLAAGYEADPEKRHDLRQDIHFQLWRSFEVFDGRCSLKTWTFRVAHNTAVSYVNRERRNNAGVVSPRRNRADPDGQGSPAAYRPAKNAPATRAVHPAAQTAGPADHDFSSGGHGYSHNCGDYGALAGECRDEDSPDQEYPVQPFSRGETLCLIKTG